MTQPHELPSEQEILAMPEAEYMNPLQLAFFHDRLTRQLELLRDQAQMTAHRLREVENVSDPADRASLEEEYTVNSKPATAKAS
ncbi:MAG TPA: hypothetical protein VLU73_15150 [Methylococcaceae bacterium]|jgi:DnaK suppressor protein|nr:hypothetical protein [Methylococcaceae bacterium]